MFAILISDKRRKDKKGNKKYTSVCQSSTVKYIKFKLFKIMPSLTLIALKSLIIYDMCNLDKLTI